MEHIKAALTALLSSHRPGVAGSRRGGPRGVRRGGSTGYPTTLRSFPLRRGRGRGA